MALIWVCLLETLTALAMPQSYLRGPMPSELKRGRTEPQLAERIYVSIPPGGGPPSTHMAVVGSNYYNVQIGPYIPPIVAGGGPRP